MGYRPQPRVLHLVFAAGSAWEGFEFKIEVMSLGDYYRFLELAVAVAGVDGEDEPNDQEAELARRITWWNLEDRATGEPQPISRATLLAQDPAMVRAMKRTYIDNLTSIPDGDPLAWSSTSGALELAAELPAEALGPAS